MNFEKFQLLHAKNPHIVKDSSFFLVKSELTSQLILKHVWSQAFNSSKEDFFSEIAILELAA